MATLAATQGILSGNTAPTPIAVGQATPSSVLQNQFFQTPAYQLQYGNNTSLDPAQRFLNDSGTQLSIQAGLNPLTNSYAAKGLQSSGAEQQALAQYMYGNYNSYQTQQQNLFNNYQNQLSGLVTQGAANSGASTVANAGTTQAGLLSGNDITTGTNTANANLSTSSNISQLLANLGISNASGYLNTGAAQSSNLLSGLSLLTQLNQATAAGQAASASSGAAGAGNLAGAQSSSSAGGGLF